jgi:16S rRNA (guanine966-N2)-methyltransferase
VRPTAETLRAACLKLIEQEIPGARVLDLFAGSGALGLEALSRGARSCDFVENNPAALHALKANVAKLRVREKTRLFKRDAIPFVEQLAAGAYDIAFADPPYGSKKLDRVLARWETVAFCRILVLEHAADHPIQSPGRSVRVEDSIATVLTAP